MKKNTMEKVADTDAFLREAAKLMPVARGTVSLVRKPCSRPSCRLCRSGRSTPR